LDALIIETCLIQKIVLILNDPEVQKELAKWEDPAPPPKFWTDDYSNLFSLFGIDICNGHICAFLGKAEGNPFTNAWKIFQPSTFGKLLNVMRKIPDDARGLSVGTDLKGILTFEFEDIGHLSKKDLRSLCFSSLYNSISKMVVKADVEILHDILFAVDDEDAIADDERSSSTSRSTGRSTCDSGTIVARCCRS
jgi:hypothetical protein